MAGRRLASESELLRKGYTRADFVRRREVLRETLAAFETADPKDKYQLLASANLNRWKSQFVGEQPLDLTLGFRFSDGDSSFAEYLRFECRQWVQARLIRCVL
jgi:hypothetical protein